MYLIQGYRYLSQSSFSLLLPLSAVLFRRISYLNIRNALACSLTILASRLSPTESRPSFTAGDKARLVSQSSPTLFHDPPDLGTAAIHVVCWSSCDYLQPATCHLLPGPLLTAPLTHAASHMHHERKACPRPLSF